MTRDRVTCVQLGTSGIQIRHRTVRTDMGTHCLKLGVWEVGRLVAELTLPFGVLRPFRNAVAAAVNEALKARSPATAGDESEGDSP